MTMTFDYDLVTGFASQQFSAAKLSFIFLLNKFSSKKMTKWAKKL
jgi:hypothetical protein